MGRLAATAGVGKVLRRAVSQGAQSATCLSPDFGFTVVARWGIALKKRLVLALAVLGGFYWLGGKAPAPSSSSPPIFNTETAVSQAKQVQPIPVPVASQTPSVATPPSPLPKVEVIRFIRFKRVPLRSLPAKGSKILDRYDVGRKLVVLQTQGDWLQVKDALTRRVGWVTSNLVQDAEPSQDPKTPEREKKPSAPPKPDIPVLSTAVIVQRIIAASLSTYPSSCACPYNVDRGGHKCGRRSAYSRPGGYAPICFASDVTKDMMAAFRDEQTASRE